MTKKMVKDECPIVTKPHTAWLVSNWGIPWSVERTRREAIEYAQNITGKPWRVCRKYCRVQKVTVTP
jgi:hypothetical protein